MSPYSALYNKLKNFWVFLYSEEYRGVIYKSYVLQYINLYAYYLVGNIELYTPLYSPLYKTSSIWENIKIHI